MPINTSISTKMNKPLVSREFFKDHSPWIEEHDFNIKDDKEHRDEVKPDG